jgi:hypothetical protein
VPAGGHSDAKPPKGRPEFGSFAPFTAQPRRVVSSAAARTPSPRTMRSESRCCRLRSRYCSASSIASCQGSIRPSTSHGRVLLEKHRRGCRSMGKFPAWRTAGLRWATAAMEQPMLRSRPMSSLALSPADRMSMPTCTAFQNMRRRGEGARFLPGTLSRSAG